VIKPGRWRDDEELEPIANKLMKNAALIKQLRAAVGSGDKSLVSEATSEVAKQAERLSPDFGLIEGTRLSLLLLRKLGYFDTENGLR
jgi:hypothetical protein